MHQASLEVQRRWMSQWVRQLNRNTWNSRIQVQLSVRRGSTAVLFHKAAAGAVELHRFGGSEGHKEVVARLCVGDASFWVEDASARTGTSAVTPLPPAALSANNA